jgi:hypothetical protein
VTIRFMVGGNNKITDFDDSQGMAACLRVKSKLKVR